MRRERTGPAHGGRELPREIRAGFLAAFAALAIVAMVSLALLPIQRRAQHWVDHTLAVLRSIQQINRSLDSAQSEAWSATFSGRPPAPSLGVSLEEVHHATSTLTGLTRDNPAQQARLTALLPELDDVSRVMQESKGLERMSTPAYVATLGSIRSRLSDMRFEELRLLQSRQERVQRIGTGLEVVIAVGSAVLLFLLAIALSATRREFRRRAELTSFQSRLAGIITHDLRSPLAAILATASLLEREQLEGGPSLRRIVGSARRMDRLLGLLTAFTSMQLAGDVTLEREPVELSAVTRKAVEYVGQGNPTAQLTLKVERDAVGAWDRLLLTTALSTLLDAVLRRSPVGSALELRVAREAQDALLTVVAPAAVLPSDERERLFEPLSREPDDADTVSYSSGIGLSVARAIVDAHGGSLALERLGERGAIFHVRLPRSATPASLTEPEAAPPLPA